MIGAYPSWSPDGTKIAYYSNGDESIHVINADGSNDTNLGVPGSVSPVWSPDGTKIAYVSFYTQTVHVVDMDGFDTDLGVPGTTPAWSPDGTKIAYIVYSNDNDFIHVINAYGSNDTDLGVATDSSLNW